MAVQDHDGNIFVGENIAADGSALLTSSSYVAAAAKFRQLLTENLPQLPAGYVEPRRYRGQEYGVSMSSSLMELQLEALTSPVASGWGNGTYLAVTDSGIAVSLGSDEITETDSFHVLRGQW